MKGTKLSAALAVTGRSTTRRAKKAMVVEEAISSGGEKMLKRI